MRVSKSYVAVGTTKCRSGVDCAAIARSLTQWKPLVAVYLNKNFLALFIKFLIRACVCDSSRKTIANAPWQVPVSAEGGGQVSEKRSQPKYLKVAVFYKPRLSIDIVLTMSSKQIFQPRHGTGSEFRSVEVRQEVGAC